MTYCNFNLDYKPVKCPGGTYDKLTTLCIVAYEYMNIYTRVKYLDIYQIRYQF